MNDRLESWKEVATYLKRDIRTVQRWEKTRGLPVQRVPGGKRDLITAQKSDIDKWWQSSSGQLATEEAGTQVQVPVVRRRMRLLLWIAPPLAFAAAAAWLLIPRAPAPESYLKPVPLTSYPGRELEPCFSPDGSMVAFSWNGEGEDNFDIYIQVLGTQKPLRLTSDPRVDINPSWSPDGRSVAFLRELTGGKAEIRLVPALGGPERKVGDVDTLGRSRHPLLAWAQDGKNLVVVHKLFAGEPYGLFLISSSGGTLRRLTSPPPGGRGDSGAAFSPDGRTLAFSRMPGGPGLGELHLLSVTEDLQPRGVPTQLTRWNRITVGPTWTSGGRELVVNSDPGGTLWRVPVASPGQPRQLQSLGEEAYQPVISRPLFGDPSLVFVRKYSDTNIWSVSIAGGTNSPVIASTQNDEGAQFSPDGSMIAYLSNRTGQSEIWVSNRERSNAVQLGSVGELNPGSLHWSPDGKRLVFDCRAPGPRDVCVMDVEGGKPRRVTEGRSHDAVPSWSRNGQWIYFGSTRGGEPQVWRIPVTGGTAVQVTKKGGWAALESHDGRMLYYVKDSGIHPALWSVPATGGEERQVLDSVRARAFAVTGRGIYFIPRLDPDGRGTLRFFDFSTRMNTVVARTDKTTGLGLSVSPDMGTILYTRVDREGSDLMVAPNFR